MDYRHLIGMFYVWMVVLLCSGEISKYDGYRVLRIGPLRNSKEVKIVEELLDRKSRQVTLLKSDIISEGHTFSLLVSAHNFHIVRYILRRYRIPYVTSRRTPLGSFRGTIFEDKDFDGDAAAEEDIAPQVLHESLVEQQPDHTRYMTFEEQYTWLQRKVASSNVAQMYSLTSTYEGRPLPCIMINYQFSERPMVWIDANLRACDWITSGVGLYLIDQILNGQSDDPVFLRTHFRIMIAPNANPDGYEYSRLTDRLWVKNRKPNSSTACIGVDLSKNFPVNFGVDGSSDDPCSDNYPGPEQFSEEESQAIDYVLEPYRDSLKFFFSLQAYGQQWLLPFAYSMSHPADYNELERVANLSVSSMRLIYNKSYMVGAESEFSGKVSGTSYDYAKIYYSIPYAYTIRLRPETAGEGGVDIPPSQIIPVGQEILAGIAEACRQARVLPQTN